MPQVGVIFSTCVIMLHNLSLEFHQRKDRKFTKNVTPLHLYIVYSDENTDVQNDLYYSKFGAIYFATAF